VSADWHESPENFLFGPSNKLDIGFYAPFMTLVSLPGLSSAFAFLVVITHRKDSDCFTHSVLRAQLTKYWTVLWGRCAPFIGTAAPTGCRRLFIYLTKQANQDR
jgi:hypothetical protein